MSKKKVSGPPPTDVKSRYEEAPLAPSLKRKFIKLQNSMKFRKDSVGAYQPIFDEISLQNLKI